MFLVDNPEIFRDDISICLYLAFKWFIRELTERGKKRKENKKGKKERERGREGRKRESEEI